MITIRNRNTFTETEPTTRLEDAIKTAVGKSLPSFQIEVSEGTSSFPFSHHDGTRYGQLAHVYIAQKWIVKLGGVPEGEHIAVYTRPP